MLLEAVSIKTVWFDIPIYLKLGAVSILVSGVIISIVLVVIAGTGIAIGMMSKKICCQGKEPSTLNGE